jgi:hypothetical protein
MQKGTSVAVKLLMTWDVRAGQEALYSNFVLQELMPGLGKLGVRPIEAWYTVYGDAPQILASVEAEDMRVMERVLRSEEWQRLKGRLLNYVTNYRQKVVQSTGRFQLP